MIDGILKNNGLYVSRYIKIIKILIISNQYIIPWGIYLK